MEFAEGAHRLPKRRQLFFLVVREELLDLLGGLTVGLHHRPAWTAHAGPALTTATVWRRPEAFRPLSAIAVLQRRGAILTRRRRRRAQIFALPPASGRSARSAVRTAWRRTYSAHLRPAILAAFLSDLLHVLNLLIREAQECPERCGGDMYQ